MRATDMNSNIVGTRVAGMARSYNGMLSLCRRLLPQRPC